MLNSKCCLSFSVRIHYTRKYIFGTTTSTTTASTIHDPWLLQQMNKHHDGSWISSQQRNYASSFHQDHVIESSSSLRNYLTNVEYLRQHLKHNQNDSTTLSQKAKHEQNIALLLNQFTTRWNDVTLRSELALIRRKLVNFQQSFLKNNRTILSTSNIKQALQGSQYYLAHPHERKTVLQERQQFINQVNNMFKEAIQRFFDEPSNQKPTTRNDITLDVHLFNMFLDIFVRLRSTEHVWELEKSMEQHDIKPNLTTLIFLTDACRIENKVEKAVHYYRLAVTRWSDTISLDTSYWNHFLSALALVGTDSMNKDTSNAALSVVSQDNALLAKYFSIMIDSGFEPDEDTFRFVILGSRNIQVMMDTLDVMENQYGLYYLKCYESISMFLAKNHFDPTIASNLFQRLLKNRKRFKDSRSHSSFALDQSTAKTIGYAEDVSPTEQALEYQHGLKLELTSVFEHLIHAYIPPHSNLTTQLNLDMILTIYDHAVTVEQLKPTTHMMEDLIDAYCRVGNMKEAWIVLRRMKEIKLFKNNSIRIHWKMLTAYKFQNDLKGASTVMKDALESRVKLNEAIIRLYFEMFKKRAEMEPLVIFCSLIDAGFVNINQHQDLLPIIRSIYDNLKNKFGLMNDQHLGNFEENDHSDLSKFQKISELLRERGLRLRWSLNLNK
ncbi:hypothetical protein FDP41_005041 [Naegleria fowleri]|uniref:Pentacotripeptide-repeat region of PRORP domain-containing protein n=1 Tax=Naegleria fowleri TaxID=5763 RepID=A0A6A5BNP7_NAEFO|nr:uncharacterized protein FDP41_005041 [Naegleria fowleri]KAF0975714.1 hypothetical protein FDP41_005041 [Naegleria fowleri]CAG4719258.1 unnamed protein product [Naegleria fowleri]